MFKAWGFRLKVSRSEVGFGGFRIYRDHGKENGNYRDYRVSAFHRGYIKVIWGVTSHACVRLGTGLIKDYAWGWRVLALRSKGFMLRIWDHQVQDCVERSKLGF